MDNDQRQPQQPTLESSLEQQAEESGSLLASELAKSWGPVVKQSQADGDADIAARRARVLRHEDLCAKLRQPPLGFEKAEQWNGFVPPKYIPNQHGNMVLNNSARRAALVDIDLIAISREQASE